MTSQRFLRVFHAFFLLVLVVTSSVAQMHFAKPVVYDSGGAGAGSVAIADLNHDGKLDLVVVNGCQSAGPGFCNGTGQVAVLLGNGNGTFQPAVTYNTGAYLADSVSLGDLNGDGIPDVVVSNLCQDQNCRQSGAVSVLLGNGDGTFRPAVVYSSGDPLSLSLALGDLNGDGKLDVVVSNTYFGGIQSEGSVSVLLGNGDGTFQPAVSYGSGWGIASSVAISEVNGDGHPDLVVANFCGGSGCYPRNGEVGVLLGNGDSTFQPAVLYDSGGEFAISLAVGDLRGNGILDVVVANEFSDNEGKTLRGEVSVLLGNGNGTFQPAVSYLARGVGAPSYPAIGSESDSLAIADVNGDGIPDVLVMELCQNLSGGTCVGDGQVNVFLGNGDGTFQAPVVYSSDGFGGSAIAIADLDGDGRPDLVAVSEQVSPSVFNGLIAVKLNKTSYKTTTVLTSSPNPSQVNQTVKLTATITSSLAIPSGEVVNFYAGTTKLGKSAITNGVATLTTSFSKANTYTLKAKYPGDTWHKPSYGTVSQVVNP